ncbi:glycosyltransferase family 4 protein [Pseudomonas sp. J452]|uniref:glycosyltransferase family 4 protein n=1 Tax=Pseudomonas sp. J452 TaxID=2898441 RepID=UPI0021ADB685|nr:glycosyltransferase family 4 protein [Pseudomonas sp. J452]UUY09833.1 glycosyltransferase family 4 protein [Pseudomonas sp. J452]
MKVLHFYKSYYPDSFGGVEQVIYQLAEGAQANGIDTEVLFLSPQGAARNRPIGKHLSHCSKRDLQIASTAFSLSAFSDFKELAREADLVHYHFPWPFMDLVHFASRLNKPCVVSYHSDIVKQKTLLQLYKPLMHSFLSHMDRIVASSPNYVDTSEVLQRYREKIRVIPYGLDRSTYVSPSQQTLDKWQSRIGSKFFLFMGVLRYYKGLHILLEAMAGSPYPVVIAGAGPIENELREQAAQLGLTNLRLVGEVSEEDKAALFQLCYAVLFPSHLRSEAFGISLLEGAMYGKALISSEIGTGTTFVNIDGTTGIVVPPSAPATLRTAMDRLWSDPQLCETLGQQAKQRYESLFTSQHMVERYMLLYREVLDSR